MKSISQKLTIEVKHYRDCRNRKYVCLEATDSLGKVCYIRAYMYDPRINTWQYEKDGRLTEVTQEHVFRDFVNTYKSLMSVEDLISENLIVAEEGY